MWQMLYLWQPDKARIWISPDSRQYPKPGKYLCEAYLKIYKACETPLDLNERL